MANKFSIKKLAAGVLALLMVVTALPVSGLTASTAKAAEVLSVYRSYNPNSGEHFMTIDKAEHDSVVKAGRSDEGTAWIAPAESDTPIYRSYNPNTGEHLLVPKAEAEWLVTQGWNNEGIKIYSAEETGTPIYRLYNPNATDAGTHLYTASKKEADDLVALGWKADYDFAPVFYGVSDLSDVVTLVDANGLQDDGTALVGDTLQIIFGSSLGVPKSVVWYKSGAVVKTNVSGTLAATADFSLTTSNAGAIGAGTYYAVVENTQGETFKTNTIVVADEGVPVLYDFNISDNYEALAKYGASTATAAVPYIIPVDTKTGYAVVDLTINKSYEGNLYIIDAEKEAVAASDILNTIKIFSAKDTVATTIDEVKESKFTNEVLYDTCVGSATANGAIKKHGIYFKDSDGAYHFKLLSDLVDTAVINNTTHASKVLTRGKDYVAVFSESALTNGDKLEDMNVSETVTCPYVLAPDSVVIKTRQTALNSAAGWTAQLMLGETEASWITGPIATIGGLHLYKAAKQDGSDAAAFTGGAGTPADMIAAGAVTEINNDDTGTFVLAKFESSAGIFGEEKVKLTSDVIDKAFAPATKITLSEDTTDPTSAVVEFESLRSDASGTVYILQGSSGNTTLADIVKNTEIEDAIASATVKGGTQKVTIEDVFEKVDATNTYKNVYVALFVPDKDDTYTVMADGTGSGTTAYTLTQKPTSFTMEDVTDATGTPANGIAKDNAATKVYDQFGNEWKTDANDDGKIDALTGGIIGKTFEMKALKAEGLTKSATLKVEAGGTDGNLKLTFVTYDRTGTENADAGTVAGESVYYAKVGTIYIVATKTATTKQWTLSVSETEPTL